MPEIWVLSRIQKQGPGSRTHRKEDEAVERPSTAVYPDPGYNPNPLTLSLSLPSVLEEARFPKIRENVQSRDRIGERLSTTRGGPGNAGALPRACCREHSPMMPIPRKPTLGLLPLTPPPDMRITEAEEEDDDDEAWTERPRPRPRKRRRVLDRALSSPFCASPSPQ